MKLGAKQIQFTNGMFAEYDANGKWILVSIDERQSDYVHDCGYLNELIEKHSLVRA